MRIAGKPAFGQLSLLRNSISFCFLCFLLFVLSFLVISSCNPKREETPVIPPLTSPLSRDYIGFGVITSSFTHLTDHPSDGSLSIGYLRRGSLVRIVRRQTVRTQSGFVSWVLIDGTETYLNGNSAANAGNSGWLKEEVMDIYDNESQARTASEYLLR